MLAATLRLATVAILAGFVIRDMLRPDRDVVRDTYPDDPDGGVFDGAPDAAWLAGLRRPAVLPDHRTLARDARASTSAERVSVPARHRDVTTAR